MKTELLPAACLIAILTGCGAPGNDVTIVEPKYRIVEGNMEQCKAALVQDLANESPLPSTKDAHKLFSMQAMSFFTLIQPYSEEMQARLLNACIGKERSQAVPRKPAVQSSEGVDL